MLTEYKIARFVYDRLHKLVSWRLMEHFVTLFDSLFLPQGLGITRMSMERHVGNYTLWILCVDDGVHDVLIKIKLPNVKLLKLSLLETEELKQDQARAFYWRILLDNDTFYAKICL